MWLELELTWLGLKPSQNSWYLVSGPNGAQVLDVSSKKESVRDKAIGNKCVIHRKTHSTGPVWAVTEGKCGLEM